MSTSWILLVGLLVYFARVGTSLKCYTYTCRNTTGAPPGVPTNPPCAPQRETTCTKTPGMPMEPDRCVTQRLEMKMKTLGSVLSVNQETRNCSYSLQCGISDVFCKAANITGQVTKCELGCCQGDLCNSGGPIPTQGPKPTGPSGSDLSCYSCSSMNIPGVPTAKADCKNPAKQTCGAGMNPGMQQDRCVRMKLRVGFVEQEMRNCSGAFMCNKDLVCNNANKTGMISSCDVSCCFGNLCNTDVTPTGYTTTDTVTDITAVPTVVGSGNTLTGAMTCLLVVIGKVLLGDING